MAAINDADGHVVGVTPDGRLLVSIDGSIAAANVGIKNAADIRVNPATEEAVNNLLTNTQLRAAPVPVSGPLTDAELRAASVPVSGPLTDAQLRASQVRVQEDLQYFASLAGGRVAFGIPSNSIAIDATGEQRLAALVNPAGSGKDIYIDSVEFGSSLNSILRQYAGTALGGLGASILANNLGGGSPASVGRLYAGASFVRTGGTVSRAGHIASYQQHQTDLKGGTVIRPGQNIVWTIQNASGGISGFTASIYLEYWELNAV